MPKYPYRDLGTSFDRNFRNDLNANFDDIEADVKDLDTRIDNIVSQAGSDNTEIVDARYDSINNATYPTLKDRLDAHSNEIGILNKSLSSKFNFEVEIIAHRGFSHIAPENTIIAMETAISYGADSLEFDVQISSDGVPVCIHDSTVDRTTEGTGNVKDLTLAQLQALDAGSFLSPIYAGVKIPTLDDVLKVAKRKSKYIYPEIKGYRTTDDIPLIVNKIIEHGFEDKCVIQSFNYDTDFPIVRTVSKRITLGYLVSTETAFNDALSKASADGNGAILTYYSVVLNNPSLVQNARTAGVDVAVWTVDDLSTMQSLFEIGVVRIMTNRARGGAI
jgi:glycerophosphoryl diester phosphodiesterase